MPSDDISLREFLQARIEALELRIRTEHQAAEEALRIQAREYERRLDQLNHAHEQAREKERDFIGRDTYDVYVRTMGARVDKIEATVTQQVGRDRMDAEFRSYSGRLDELVKRISEAERSKANLDGRFSMLAMILSGMTIVINLIFSYILRR